MYLSHYPDNRNPEDDWQDFKECCRRAVKVYFWFAIVALLLMCLFSSCRSVQQPTIIHTTTTDTMYISRLQYDSIVRHDSIYLDRWRAGDTIFIYKHEQNVEYRTKLKTDTLFKIRHDTVPQPYPVVEKVEVERKLNFFMKTLLWTGGLTLGIGILLIAMYVGRFIVDIRKLKGR